MSEIKNSVRLFSGRKIKEEKVFEKDPGTMDFTPYYQAINHLVDHDYSPGFMDGNNPVGFYAPDHKGFPPPEWGKMTKEQKDNLAGIVMSSDFRSDDVKIVFFQDQNNHK